MQYHDVLFNTAEGEIRRQDQLDEIMSTLNRELARDIAIYVAFDLVMMALLWNSPVLAFALTFLLCLLAAFVLNRVVEYRYDKFMVSKTLGAKRKGDGDGRSEKSQAIAEAVSAACGMEKAPAIWSSGWKFETEASRPDAVTAGTPVVQYETDGCLATVAQAVLKSKRKGGGASNAFIDNSGTIGLALLLVAIIAYWVTGNFTVLLAGSAIACLPAVIGHVMAYFRSDCRKELRTLVEGHPEIMDSIGDDGEFWEALDKAVDVRLAGLVKWLVPFVFLMAMLVMLLL